MSLAANGRGPPDVVVAFADGQSYSRTKLDEVARSGFFDPKAAAPKAKEVGHGKKEDVEYIVREMEISRAEAERVLSEHAGDLEAALRTLVCANWGSSGGSESTQ